MFQLYNQHSGRCRCKYCPKVLIIKLLNVIVNHLILPGSVCRVVESYKNDLYCLKTSIPHLQEGCWALLCNVLFKGRFQEGCWTLCAAYCQYGTDKKVIEWYCATYFSAWKRRLLNVLVHRLVLSGHVYRGSSRWFPSVIHRLVLTGNVYMVASKVVYHQQYWLCG